MKKKLFYAAISSVVISGFAHATAADSADMHIRPVGMGSFEAGQLVRCEILGGDKQTEKLWYQKAYMHIGFTSVVNERTNLFFIGEGMVRYPFCLSKDKIEDNRPGYLVLFCRYVAPA